MTQLDMGKDLRDAALDKSGEGREEQVATIREILWWNRINEPDHFTADDVWEAAHRLGYTDGDTRWLAHVTRNWGLVEPTDRFVPSRRKSRHAAPVRVWRFK